MSVPRLVLGVLLGVVIGEPIVLTVFETSISAEMARQDAAYLADYESKLTACNPVPHVAVYISETACDGYDLPGGPENAAKAVQAELAEARAAVNRDNGLLARISAFQALGESHPIVEAARRVYLRDPQISGADPG